jgi:[histone H3]-lysine4 N-trimethyltransferase SETD1
VIEYVGEKIRVPVADKREVLYTKIGVGDCYLFSLDNEHIIDATFYGCKARYINHSCDPNLKSDKLVISGETHIIFIANRYIESGEELTFDYQFDYEAEKIPCFCGSYNCKGRLN